MKKSYTDECIEKFSKELEPIHDVTIFGGQEIVTTVRLCDTHMHKPLMQDGLELAKRLKKAISYLKAYDATRYEKELAEELEAPLEGK